MKFKLKESVLIFLVVMSLFVMTACSGNESTVVDTNQDTSVEESKQDKEVPTIVISWGKSLHTGMMQLNFIKPEIFENNPVHLRPIGDKQLELVKDGEVLAIFDYVVNDGGSHAATMMTQGTLDISYNSSTAIISLAILITCSSVYLHTP